IGLSGDSFILFQTRFALFVKHMMETGPTWFPVTYDRPFPDYPVTPTLMIYFTSKMMGGLDRVSAVLPSAIASAVTVSFTYLIAARLDRRWGYASVLFSFLCLGFVSESRTISMDQFTTAVSTVSFYLALASDRAKSRKYLFAFALLFAIGFLFRGPIGVIVPTAVICIFFLVNRDIKGFFIIGVIGAMVLIACSLGLLAAAYHVGGMEFVSRVIDMEVADRLSRANEPFHFYLTHGPGNYSITFVVAVLVVLVLLLPSSRSNTRSILANLDTDHRRLLSALIGWALVVIIGLSFAATKKTRYILPAMPALSLLAGYILVIPDTLSSVAKWLRKGLAIFLLLAPLAFMIMAIFAYHQATQRVPDLKIGWAGTFAIIGSLLLCGAVAFFGTRGNLRISSVMLTSTLCFLFVMVYLVEPIQNRLYGIKAFVEKTEAYMIEHKAGLVFYKEDPEGDPIHYLANASNLLRPRFILTLVELENLDRNSVIVIDADKYELLPDKIKRMTQIIYSSQAVARYRPVALVMDDPNNK
ncbi:MAG: glycosyltransferase family 39 protein, partial [Gammaproteobacteria bacterium]|nr:glycosyltransferase family 39 protein [Gammaproteobacteria bacterium]